ncbi:MAG: aminoglycoside phosphotransferase family protein [Deltaproteobacteria bacterium]|nr:aminoglycoside phosphotransferase family protein [Deltaproteobacteria bacterium]
MGTEEHGLVSAIRDLLARAVPGAELLGLTRFGVDPNGAEGACGTSKSVGYGEPLKLRVRGPDGRERSLVLHTARSDSFGHDRRADRAAAILLGFDRFSSVKRHVRAIDVGAFTRDGNSSISLSNAGELYLLTDYAEGRVYAEELRELARSGQPEPTHLGHVRALATLLAEIHAEQIDDPRRYRRSIRDLVGSGEGIFGMVDGYGPNVPSASPERLAGIEARAERWRFRLRAHEARLRRAHGDFHPFNILFNGDEISLLDTSRGSMADPADDLTCLAINYVFFAVEQPESWVRAFRSLWYQLWATYLELTGDSKVLEVAAPFLAWRGLVVANPMWYPHVSPDSRDRVLRFVERALDADRFDPGMADEVFR